MYQDLKTRSKEPSGAASLAPAHEPDRGEERSLFREPSQEDVCQAEDGQEHGQGARSGEEVCQAQVDHEQNTDPVPSSEGVTVSGMCVPTVGEMSNVDGELKSVCVAQLIVKKNSKNMRYVSEQEQFISQKPQNSGIAKPLTRMMTNTKPENIQPGISPLKRKYTENVQVIACNLVTKLDGSTESNLLESESFVDSPAKKRKVGGC